MKEMRGNLESAARLAPSSPLPQSSEATAPGTPADSSTLATMRVVAMAVKGVVSAGFHTTVSPHVCLKH